MGEGEGRRVFYCSAASRIQLFHIPTILLNRRYNPHVFKKKGGGGELFCTVLFFFLFFALCGRLEETSSMCTTTYDFDFVWD